MKYPIEIVPGFTVLTKIRKFNPAPSKAKISKFRQKYFRKGNGEMTCGQFGICFDCDEKGSFHYGIGNQCEAANGKRSFDPCAVLPLYPTNSWKRHDADD